MIFMDQTAITAKGSNKGEPQSQYNPFTSLHEDEEDYIPTRKISKVNVGDIVIVDGCTDYVKQVFPFMVKLESGKCLSLGDLVVMRQEPESIIFDKVETKQGWRVKHE